MGKSVDLDQNEIDFLEREINYLIKKEVQMLEDLTGDRAESEAREQWIGNGFVARSQEILTILHRLHRKISEAKQFDK